MLNVLDVLQNYRFLWKSVVWNAFLLWIAVSSRRDLICNIVGLAYPSILSLYAIRHGSLQDFILTYWLIFSAFTMLESLVSINEWKPLYYCLKFSILVWCQCDDSYDNGTTLLRKLIQLPLPSIVTIYMNFKRRLLTWCFGTTTMKNAFASVPNEFLCPISLEVMLDPVVCVDGHTYERSSIERWLQQSMKSPKTNEVLYSTVLIPNHTLRSAIMEYLKEE